METKRRDNYRIDGNTVRRLDEATPDYRKIREERMKREAAEELRRKRRIANRNRERELRMGRRYVVFLMMAVGVFGLFAGTYIKIQSDLSARMRNISKLTSDIEDLKADNDEVLKRINTMIDLDSIKNSAMNELGMSYARESQIIYYTVEDDDYMKQYKEIPK